MTGDLAHLVCYEGSPEKRDKERARKRKKYAADPELRQRKIAAAKARYRKQRQHGWAGDGGPPPKTHLVRGRNKPRPWVMPDGRIITVVSAGEAADTCGVSKRTFVNYETRGVIPANRLMDERGRRWYPESFVSWLAVLLKNQSERREPLWRLRRRVERAWLDVRAHIPRLQEREHGKKDTHPC